MDMKLFGKPIENLFKSRTEVVKEGLVKPILTIRDLEDTYKEFADHEDKYTGDFNDFVDLETQAEYKYWDGAGDPESRGRGMTDYERAANIAADEDMDILPTYVEIVATVNPSNILLNNEPIEKANIMITISLWILNFGISNFIFNLSFKPIK